MTNDYDNNTDSNNNNNNYGTFANIAAIGNYMYNNAKGCERPCPPTYDLLIAKS